MKRNVTISICWLIVCATPALAQMRPKPFTSPFYPLEVGHRWTYRSTDLKAAAAKADPKRNVVVEVERDEIYVDKQKNKDGTDASKEYLGYILKSTSGGKSTRDHVCVMPAGVHRIHAAETPIAPPLLFFKLTDLKPGDTWTCDSASGNKTIKGTFAAKREDVNVPIHKEKIPTYRISFTNNKAGDERVEIDYWFAPNVGMVKQHIRVQNHDILLELEDLAPAAFRESAFGKTK